MSLTSILSNKNNQELRNKLKTEFLRPEFNLKSEIKAVPLTTNGRTVGTAFDYLMRFYLQFHNKDTFIQRETWVADQSYKSLTSLLTITEQKEIRTGFNRDKIFKTKDLLKIINIQFEQTKNNYQKYISNGQLTDELISNTLFLAKLDLYFRSKIIDHTFDCHDQNDIKDLKSLIYLVDIQNFKAKEKCYFNPTFGIGSLIVGGADADLIIDNTLIDIKATKHLKLEREHLNQVLGYYVLSLIGGVNNSPNNKPIENIGLYFARHGELWKLPLCQFGDQRKFEDFKHWFISYVTRNRGILLNDLKDSMLSFKAKSKLEIPIEVKTQTSINERSDEITQEILELKPNETKIELEKQKEKTANEETNRLKAQLELLKEYKSLGLSKNEIKKLLGL
jgi:hypothetical protein